MRSKSPLRPGPALLALVLLMAVAGGAAAHAVVYPERAPTGAYQKYVLRVPNERTVPTERVEITFPAGVRVISFDEVPGWTLETDSPDGGATYSAATWTGRLPAGRFVEFAFIGVNPADPVRLQWNVVQEYEGGEAVAWTGPEDSSTPASFTTVGDPVGAGPDAEAASAGAPGAAESGQNGAFGIGAILGAVAILLSLLSLGLVLRRGGPDRLSAPASK